MFTKLQLAAVSFIMSVHLSIYMEQLGFHWSIFMKFDASLIFEYFFKNLSIKFRFHYNWARIMDTLREEQYTFF